MQNKYAISLLNKSNPDKQIFVTACDTFFSQFIGLMFRKHLSENEGILLIQPKANKIDSTIHMFFMNFDISVFWLDDSQQVVDKTIAKRWRPYYAPKQNAKFVLETHLKNYSAFNIGDSLSFEKI
jgi:uncharacterized membrane protein (UPF0127 family)